MLTAADTFKLADNELGENNLIQLYFAKFEMNLNGYLLVETEVMLFHSGSCKLFGKGKRNQRFIFLRVVSA